MSSAARLHRDVEILAALLGVPCSEVNRPHLECILAERRRLGLRLGRPRSVAAVLAELEDQTLCDDGMARNSDVSTAQVRVWPEAVNPGEQTLPTMFGEHFERYLPLGRELDGAVRARDHDLRRDVLLRLAPLRNIEGELARVRLHARLEHPYVQPLHDFGIASLGMANAVDRVAAAASKFVFSVECDPRQHRVLAELLDEAIAVIAGSELLRDEGLHRGAELLGYLADASDAMAHAHHQRVARGGVDAHDITIGRFGEVSLWNWTSARSWDEDDAAGIAALRRDLHDLGALVERVCGICSMVLEGDLAAVVADLVDQTIVDSAAADSGAARLALALRQQLEQASEVAWNRRAARHELELGNLAWGRLFAAQRQLDNLAEEFEALSRFGVDASLDAGGFDSYRECEEGRRRALAEVASARADAMRHFRAAARDDPGNPDARDALARLHWELLEEGRRWGSEEQIQFHRRALERYDGGSRLAWLREPGQLAVDSDPPGARVTLYRYRREFGGRVLEPELVREIGVTPTAPIRVPQDSYLLVLEREGFPAVRHPVLVGPGFEHVERVRLVAEKTIGHGMVYVPRGTALIGGDPDVPRTGYFRERLVPGFLVGRTHVTCGEYLEFLNYVDAHDPVQAARRQPRTAAGGGGWWRHERGRGYFFPPPQATVDREWSADLPILGVSYEDALAFMAWDSVRQGRAMDVPAANAWEKAARGVDGRFFPWGNHADETFGNVARGVPRLLPVGSEPRDVSVFMVADCFGNVQDFCHAHDARTREIQCIVRGSAYLLPADLGRSANWRPFRRDLPGHLHSFRRFAWLAGEPGSEG